MLPRANFSLTSKMCVAKSGQTKMNGMAYNDMPHVATEFLLATITIIIRMTT